MYGVNVSQMKSLVRDTLKAIWPNTTENAVNLVLGTAMAESRLSYIRQLNGPALGFFQMEPNTFNDIKVNFLAYRNPLLNRIKVFVGCDLVPEALIWNLRLAIIMCRLQYLRAAGSLPTDAASMAAYHKCNYNTVCGKADASQNVHIFQDAING